MKLEELYQKVVSDEALKAEFTAAVKENRLAAFLAAQGCEATLEEVVKYLEVRQSAQGELSDDELDAVAGGTTVEEWLSSTKMNTGTVNEAENALKAGFQAVIVNVCA